MRAATASTRGILNPDAGAAHFELTRHAPAPAVAERVERHWIVRWDLRGRPAFTQEVLPHPCVNLVFQNGHGGVFGIARRTDSRRLEGVGMAVGTKFRPGAFAAFVDLPMTKLVGAALSVEQAFGADGRELEREVAGRASVADQIAAVERFVAARFPGPDPGFDLVCDVVADMLTCPPGARVEEVAARHGVSARTLQRTFRRYIGVGPKWVLQRYPLHEAAERIAAGEAEDLTRLALDLGYFDLAHFTGAFRRAVGRTPTAFMRACAAA